MVKFHVCIGNYQTRGLRIFGHIVLRHITSTSNNCLMRNSHVIDEFSERQVILILAITVGILLTFCCGTCDVFTLVGMNRHNIYII